MTFDLADTITTVLEQFAQMATSGDVVLRDESVPTPLVADEGLLIQLLVNLVDNAITHTPPDGRVSVGCRGDDGVVRIWVTDTGEGIAPEHQARIFDRFARIDSGRGRAQGGVGLGLAICKAIVEVHGGSIALTSAPGRGARIDILFPVGTQPAVRC